MIPPQRTIIFSHLARRAFSLVEVTMALGIVAFSMLAILGTLPVGLTRARESALEVTMAKISQQVRGELSSIPFSATLDRPLAIDDLKTQTDYYSLEGMKSTKEQSYFEVTYDVHSPLVSGVMEGFGGSARTVAVTLSYPQSVAATQRETKVFSLLVARQAND